MVVDRALETEQPTFEEISRTICRSILNNDLPSKDRGLILPQCDAWSELV